MSTFNRTIEAMEHFAIWILTSPIRRRNALLLFLGLLMVLILYTIMTQLINELFPTFNTCEEARSAYFEKKDRSIPDFLMQNEVRQYKDKCR